jgi:CheY-like chemotaxis protein
VGHVATNSETILLAEDQPSIRQEVRESLEAKDYNVLEAETGTDAFDIAERYPGTIDVLVTDVIMPQLWGFELARRVGQLHSDLSVVFMSGYSEASRLGIDRSRFSGKMVASAQKTNRCAQVLAPRVGLFSTRIDLGSIGCWFWKQD